MKTKKKTSTVKRPYAPSPRWYATETGRLMRHEAVPFNVREIALVRSRFEAEKLARALNRGERDAGVVEGLRATLRAAADHAEKLRSALNALVTDLSIKRIRLGREIRRGSFFDAVKVLGDQN